MSARAGAPGEGLPPATRALPPSPRTNSPGVVAWPAGKEQGSKEAASPNSTRDLGPHQLALLCPHVGHTGLSGVAGRIHHAQGLRPGAGPRPRAISTHGVHTQCQAWPWAREGMGPADTAPGGLASPKTPAVQAWKHRLWEPGRSGEGCRSFRGCPKLPSQGRWVPAGHGEVWGERSQRGTV